MKYDGFGDARLEINFDVDRPVELVQLTLALQAMARDYRRYANDTIRESGGKVSDDDIRLYVTKVETGSIIAELGSAAQVMGAFLPLVQVSPLFAGYVEFFWRISLLLCVPRKTDGVKGIRHNRNEGRGPSDG